MIWASEDLDPSDPSPAPEGKVEGKLSDFWFYHKWKILIGIAVLVFLIVCLAQLAERKTYDAYLMYVGPVYLDKETVKDLLGSVETASDSQKEESGNPADSNRDGTVTLDLNALVYLSEEQIAERRNAGSYVDLQENQSAKTHFSQMLTIGEYAILLLDRSLYDETVNSGAFSPWEDTTGVPPENALDSYGILLSELDIGSENGFRQLPDNTVLCFRKRSYFSSVNSHVQKEEIYEAERALFCQLIRYRKEN